MKLRKILSWVLVLAMLFNTLSPFMGNEKVYAASTGLTIAENLDLSVSNDGKGTLGRNEKVKIIIKNNNPDKWVYNLSLEAVLDSGLTIDSSVNPLTSAVEEDTSILVGEPSERAQKVTWKDIKDLAPGEKFEFDIQVSINEKYRELATGNLNEDIDFGDYLKSAIRIYGGDAPQALVTSGLEKKSNFRIQVFPFEVLISRGEELLKGAGVTIDSGDNKWERTNKITIINNTKYKSEIDLRGLLPNGMEVNNFTPGYTPTSNIMSEAGDLGKTILDWGTIELPVNETKELNYDTAIFNKYYTETGVNTGTIIEDGTSLLSRFIYEGKVIIDQMVPTEIDGFNGEVDQTTIAKDIIIEKSVAPNSKVGYGDELTYTLNVKTNQYIDMSDVVVTDEFGTDETLGAGQVYETNKYSGLGYNIENQSSTVSFNHTSDKNSGKTTLKWRLGTVVKAKDNLKIEFKTKVLEKWKKADIFVVANDTIHNNVKVDAINEIVGDTPTDSSYAYVKTAMPLIIKKALQLNGQPIADKGATPVEVNVGDKVKFEVTYQASGVAVKQKEVEISDYLPIGMTVVPNTVTYVSGGSEWDKAAKSFVPANTDIEVLTWGWDSEHIPQNTTDLTVQYEAVVNDVSAVTMGKEDYNLAKLSLKNTFDIVDSYRDQVQINYTEPNLTIIKTSNGNDSLTNVVGATQIPFELKITNDGTGTAYDIKLKDTLPTELKNPEYISSTSSKSSNTITTNINSGTSKDIVFDNIDKIEAGETVTINYKATTIDVLGNLRNFNNNATIDLYYSGTGEKGRVYIDKPNDSVNMTAKNVAITKTVVERESDPLRIGDWVIYKINIIIPAGTVSYNAKILENIPNNQSLLGVYDTYSGSVLSDVMTMIPAVDTIADINDFRITLPTPLGVGTYDYYVKTKIDKITAGNTEIQTNDAKLEWEDAITDPISHNSSKKSVAVMVKRPQLNIALTSDKTTLIKDEVAIFTATIDNVGENTAYNFIPTVNVPEGFDISDISGSGTYDESTHTITFPVKSSLTTGDASLIYTFTATLNEIKGSGSTQSFKAYTGDYYTLPDDSGTPKGEKLDSVVAIRDIRIPSVIIQKTITETGLETETSSGDLTYIRAGDTVTYNLKITVPAGTTAYNVRVDDMLPTDFEIISTNIANASSDPIYFLHDFGDIDASVSEIVKNITVIARAKIDSSYNEGATNQKTERNTARVTWNRKDGDSTSSTSDTSAKDIAVKVPKITVGTIIKDDTQLNNIKTEIEVTIPVTNKGQAIAYNGIYKAHIPAELDLVTATINNSGSYDLGSRTITWSNISTDVNEMKQFKFKVKLNDNGQTGAGLQAIPINFTVDRYQSKPDGSFKLYDNDINESSYINVANANIEKVIIEPVDTSIVVRPGDSIKYKLTITVPDKTTAYNVKLQEIIGNEQEIIKLINDSDSELTLTDGEVSLSNLSGGIHAYYLEAKVKIDTSFNKNTYYAINTVGLRWEDKSTGGTLRNDAVNTTLNVGQPNMSITSGVTKETLTLKDDKGTHSIKVENGGGNPSYQVVITATVPKTLKITNISDSGVVVADDTTTTITWNVDLINKASSKTVTFDYEGEAGNATGTVHTITSKIESYKSSESDSAKIYPSITATKTVTIASEYSLSADTVEQQAVEVLQEAKFKHTITNLGAGDDSYIITHSSSYPSILYDADGITPLAKDNDGDGTFEEALNGFDLITGVAITKGGNKGFYIGFKPVISEVKNYEKDITVTAIAKGTTKVRTAIDRIKITGRAIDGITGPKDDSDNGDWIDGWSNTTISAGQKIILTALTSKDITKVKAKIATINTDGTTGGYIGDTDTTPIGLTKLTDGRFKGEYTIPNDLSNGDYFVEYYTYNEVKGTSIQGQDIKDGPNDHNNTFTINEPSLTIKLIPLTKTAVAGEEIDYTLTITNDLDGKTTAYNFTPTVKIPKGLKLKEVGLSNYKYINYTSSACITFLSDETDKKFDLANQNKLIKNFTLITANDLSADETLNISANTGIYNSANDNKGHTYIFKTTAADVKSETLKFINEKVDYNDSKYDGTSSDQENFVRPGDQIIYDLFVDIPNGLNVKDVNIKAEVYNSLITNKVLDIEKVVIKSQENLLNGSDDTVYSTTCASITVDTHAYVYARVRDDLPKGEFLAMEQAYVKWESRYRDFIGEITPNIIVIPVKQPDVNINQFVSNDTVFNIPGETITFIGSISNTGSSTAYNTKVSAVIPQSFSVKEETISQSGHYDASIRTITWDISELSSVIGSNELDFTFDLAIEATTDNNGAGDIILNLEKYYSAKHNKAKEYKGEKKEIAVSISGSQGLSNTYEKKAKVGDTVILNHTLTNAGGGKDKFEITIDNGLTNYPSKIKLGDEILAIDEDGDGSWDMINDTYKVDEKLMMALEAGAKAELILEVYVPENTAKDNGKFVTLITKGQLMNNSQNAQDKITVIGVDINGWTGNPGFNNNDLPASADAILNSIKIEWKEATRVPQKPLKLEAITSADIEGVKAIITNENGDVFGEPLVLTVVNEDTDVEKGYTLWEKVDYTLPENMPVGQYFVKYEGYLEGTLVESDNVATKDLAEIGINNYFQIVDKIKLTGTITGRKSDDSIEILPNSIVKIYDMTGKLIDETLSDENGKYTFNNIKPIQYKIVVENEKYKNADKMIDTLALVKNGIATADIQLIEFTLDLVASPKDIPGDGISQSVLTTTVLDSKGQPLSDVLVTYSAPRGTFPDGDISYTDSQGIATIKYQSEKIEGLVSQVIPVTAEVDHYEGSLHLYDSDLIYISYEPAYIKGRVVDRTYKKDAAGNIIKDENKEPVNKNEPVEGAIVEIFKDFDGDGINDFYSRFVTKSDGEYKIVIPRGDIDYIVKITKSVIVDYKNNITKDITFTQKAKAKTITADKIDRFTSDKTAVGTIYKKIQDGNFLLYESNEVYNDINNKPVILEVNIKDEEGNKVVGAIGHVDSKGVFIVENIPKTTETKKYTVNILYPVDENHKLVIGKAEIIVSKDGDISIGEALIDPYGTVTNSSTGEIIKGAQVVLYYGDNGLPTDHTIVSLPIILGFAPNDNGNPQNSDDNGKYAFMVYPDTKYYIIATKPGFNTYDSREHLDTDATIDGHITVFEEIVKYDIAMDPRKRSSSSSSSKEPNPDSSVQVPNPDVVVQVTNLDLAVQVTSDKVRYQEEDEMTFTINYKNKLSSDVDNTYIQAEIPQNTTVVDLAGGIRSGKNIIKWNIGKLKGNNKGKITWKLKASIINSAETMTKVTASIGCSNNLINKEDDRSSLDILLFSNRFEDKAHKRYIKGYPDVTFRPSRQITRAEIAAIFSRILALEKTVDNKQIYSDVLTKHWASQYIETASKKGLFGGYEDGSFKPDQAITRAELSTVIARYLELGDVEPIELHFKDTNNHWAVNAIEEIYRNKIITGYPDGNFQPNSKMIRVEAVTMINRLLKRGPLKNVDASFTDIDNSHWGFGQVEESSRTHEYNRNQDGSESMSKYIEEPLW